MFDLKVCLVHSSRHCRVIMLWFKFDVAGFLFVCFFQFVLHCKHIFFFYHVFTEPTFVSASWVQRKDDPDNEKIYVFFREKNSDHNREADPLISRVARVCKVW